MNLNQITIKSRDVNKATSFYKKLGLQLIVDASPRYVRFECPNGQSTFSISHSEKQSDTSTVLYFETKNVDKVYKKLEKSGITFASSPENKSWLWREVELNDPDGHPLKLFSAGKNRRNPPWRICAKPWYQHLLESPVNLMK